VNVLLWVGWGIVATGVVGEFLVLGTLIRARGARLEGEALTRYQRYGVTFAAVIILGLGVIYTVGSAHK
jgi:hypothetical protein